MRWSWEGQSPSPHQWYWYIIPLLYSQLIQKMGNKGRTEVTHLRKALDKNWSQAPAAEPVPTQATVISVDDANHMACSLVVATINHQKVDQETATKPVAPLPPVVGNANNSDLCCSARGWLQLQINASSLRMIPHSHLGRTAPLALRGRYNSLYNQSECTT